MCSRHAANSEFYYQPKIKVNALFDWQSPRMGEIKRRRKKLHTFFCRALKFKTNIGINVSLGAQLGLEGNNRRLAINIFLLRLIFRFRDTLLFSGARSRLTNANKNAKKMLGKSMVFDGRNWSALIIFEANFSQFCFTAYALIRF